MTVRDSLMSISSYSSPSTFSSPDALGVTHTPEKPPTDSKQRLEKRRSKATLRTSQSRTTLQAVPEGRSTPVRAAPSSPAKTDVSFAEEWEAELVKDAKNLRIKPSRQTLRDEQRKKDAEWERSGVWETQRDAAREAEERTRRDAGRAIVPRVPIRAASTAVSSVYVGVRPRLHPSRASDSMERNQPDESLPVPVSPLASFQANNLPDNLTAKAQEEYEAWLGRKEEREGGMGDNGYGTREWVPKSRVVARPSQPIEPPAPAEDPLVWNTSEYPGNTFQYPGYWDPSRWQEENRPTSKVHFAPSPEKYTAELAATGEYDLSYPCPWPRHSPSIMFGTTPPPTMDPGYMPMAYDQPPTTPYGGVGFGLGSGGMSMMGMPMGMGGRMGMGMGGPDGMSGLGRSFSGMSGLPGMGGQSPGLPGMSAFGGMGGMGMGAMGGSAMGRPAYGGSAGYGSAGGLGMGMNSPMAMSTASPMGSSSSTSGSTNMMYPPYGWGGQGYGFNPYMMMQQGAQGHLEGGLKAYDSTKAKQGRLGHYGYLEGRELAGPPPGQLPAGMQPHAPSLASSPHAQSQTQNQMPNPYTTQAASTAYYPSGAGPQRGAWGDPNSGPRARYDGASTDKKYMQADLDTPYPRNKAGGMTAAWTRYGEDKQPLQIDGRNGPNHRRMREGKV